MEAVRGRAVKIECRIGEKEKPSIEKLNPKVKS
jgi:hypothetical protein